MESTRSSKDEITELLYKLFLRWRATNSDLLKALDELDKLGHPMGATSRDSVEVKRWIRRHVDCSAVHVEVSKKLKELGYPITDEDITWGEAPSPEAFS